MSSDNFNQIPQPATLSAARVSLLPWSPALATDFFNLVRSNQNRLVDSFPILLSKTKTLESTRKFLESRSHEWEEGSIFGFMVKLLGTNEIIGYVTVKSVNWASRIAEVAYFIDKNHEGFGYVTESVKRVVIWSFLELKLKKLYVRIIPENEASKQVAIRNGFKWKSRHDFEFRTSTGELVNLDYYFLDRKDFLKE